MKQWLLVVTVASSATVVIVLSSSEYRERLCWAPVRLLGLWSYSYYALHQFGLTAGEALSIPLQSAGISAPTATVILMLVPAVVTLLTAAPFFYLVERPGLRWELAFGAQRVGYINRVLRLPGIRGRCDACAVRAAYPADERIQ
jgi:peptidoglycan/LPS O-acetylase OafA/YrhL